MELDGVNYKLQSATENAYNAVSFINEYCSEHNITNTRGEQIYIDISPTNPLYIIIFGISYIISIVQKLIYSVGCAFSISNSSESQLLNLAYLMKVRRRPATCTTIETICYAASSEQCVITTSDSITINVMGTSVVFNPLYEVTIPAGGSSKVLLKASQEGSFDIPAGTVDDFDSPVQGLRLLEQLQSLPGRPQESIPELRKRLNTDTKAHTLMNKCIEALLQLDGISNASMYYNTQDVSVTIGNTVVPPRNVLLLIQGYSTKIAETYLTYFCAPTVGTFSQGYDMNSSQTITINWDMPTALPVYLRFITNGTLSNTEKASLRDSALYISSLLTTGQELTTNDVLKICNERSPEIGLKTVYLSTDNVSWTYLVTPQEYQLITLNSGNIEVVS